MNEGIDSMDAVDDGLQAHSGTKQQTLPADSRFERIKNIVAEIDQSV